jgi:hypothetical protein
MPVLQDPLALSFIRFVPPTGVACGGLGARRESHARLAGGALGELSSTLCGRVAGPHAALLCSGGWLPLTDDA